MMGSRFDRAVWLRRGRRVAIGIALFLVVVGLLGFLVAPGIIKSVAEKQIAEALGRKATIGAVGFNPYLLAATLDDFRLYQADGTNVAFQADALTVDVSSASLFKLALVFDALKIVKPVIHVARLEPQRFDFTDIVEKLAAQPKSDKPLHYSINNIEVDDGTIDIDDRVSAKKHVVDRIHLGLPFISDLPYDAAIFVTPSFSARVDGSAIGLTGKAQPFSTSREAVLAFELADLDLTEYVDLSPTKLPFKLASGKLSATLSLAFKAASKDAAGKVVPQAIVLAGHVGLAKLDIADQGGRHALGAEAIDVDITKLDPVSGEVALARVAVVAPDVEAVRRDDGSIDLVDLFRMQAASTTPPPAPAPATAAQHAPFTIATVSITRGSARLVDRSMAKPAAVTIHDIDLQAASVALHGTTPTTYRLSLTGDEGVSIAAEGTAIVEQKKVSGTVDVKGFKPALVTPWLAGLLVARVDDGVIDAHARYRIDVSGAVPTGLIDDASLHVAHLRSSLPDEKTTLLGADGIALDGASFDLDTRAFTAESFVVTAPVVAIRRDAKGRLNFQAAVVDARPATRPAGAAVEVVPAHARPFTAVVKTFAVTRGDITLDDLSVPNAVHVRAQPFDLKASSVGTSNDAVVPFELDTGVDQRGKLSVHGKVALAPLIVDASIDASKVAVGWLAGYSGDRLNITIDSGDLDTKGTLHFAQARSADAAPMASYRGSLRVTRMRSRDRITSDPFVEWQTLDVASIDLQMPGPRAPLAVTIGKVTLDDFYARLIVNGNGRLNLQDVVSAPGDRQSVTKPEADGKPAPPAPAPAPATTTATSAPKPAIRLAGITLTKGRIGVTDNFIKPNYNANLTDLSGEIGAVASDDPKPATLKLAGRIDGEGTLDVGGSINPLAATLFTDISATAKDIELTRLTPYAVKYAGYAIERGKLSMTVKYRIENGRLDASNKLFLDQLTFGPHDPGSSADLPVRLAVALLANAKGEINVELPISGSLSDPQFSIGGVLWRTLLNLIARAATSPFALIGSAFGGGSNGELGYIQFKPGVSDLTDMGRSKLEILAKALADRPALKLDIIGRYDPATDADGLRKDHLLDRLEDAKAKELSKGGDRVTRDQVTIEPGAEYAKYLAQVYDDTKLPDKSRNAIGIAKSLSTEEMQRLLLADIKLDPNDPRWLAEARADVVRHFIEGTGKIAAGRVFLVTPKLNADGIDDQGVPNRVDFAIR